MKKFTFTQLFLSAMVLISIYSCAPKHTAHFSNSSKFYKSVPNEKQTQAPKTSARAEGIVEEEDITKVEQSVSLKTSDISETPEPQQMVVVNDKVIPVTPSPSIEKIVEDHKARVEEIESSNMESKAMKKELKRAKKEAKKEIKKELKKEIKDLKKHSGDGDYVLMMVLAVLIPPLAVGLTYGIVDKFWISLLLTLLFFIPGMIYSLIVVHNHYK